MLLHRSNSRPEVSTQNPFHNQIGTAGNDCDPDDCHPEDLIRLHVIRPGRLNRKNDASSQRGVEFDLPLSLLDRLIESRIVSYEAKIKSIESWQRELADLQSDNPRTLDLEYRLALAKRALTRQRPVFARPRIGWLSSAKNRLARRLRGELKQFQLPASTARLGVTPRHLLDGL